MRKKQKKIQEDWMDYDSGVISFDESDFRDREEDEENLESDAEETELPDEEDDFEEDPRLVRHRRKKLAVRIILIIVGVLILAYLGAVAVF